MNRVNRKSEGNRLIEVMDRVHYCAAGGKKGVSYREEDRLADFHNSQ